METHKNFFEKKGVILTLKLIMIGFLILLLLIPKFMISDLVRERKQRQHEVINEVVDKWAQNQTLIGPILAIPYKINVEEVVYNSIGNPAGKEIKEVMQNAYFLPDLLNINGNVKHKKLYRSIYEVVGYNSELKIEGFFSEKLLAEWKAKKKDILWEEAQIYFSFSDQKGVKETPVLAWNGENIEFKPGSQNIKFMHETQGNNEINRRMYPNNSFKTTSNGMHCKVKIEQSNRNKFSFTLKLKGSQNLSFAPVGKTTYVKIQSDWNAPGFMGEFLPNERKITKKGFSADWKVLHFNRNLPEIWENETTLNVSKTIFGVNFIMEADHYQKSERSAKYMILVIALTFLIFFLTEIINTLKIHIFQYILIGIAICIFFVLLLALSEHLGFNPAFLAASAGTIGLITLYSLSVFKNTKSSLLLLGLLILIFGFIFVIIQLAEYALLVGAIGLFIIIALTMYVTRKINWFES